MSDNPEVKQKILARDGVRLAAFEASPKNPKGPPFLLINGWTGDHGIFTPQIEHFGRTHRVVAIDLRGHGASDAPERGYAVQELAADVAWQCSKLGLNKPLVIGHSAGGVVALELCGRFPDLAAGLIMIDTIVMTPPELSDHPSFRVMVEGLAGPRYLEVSRAQAWDIGCDYDDPTRREWIYDTYILGPCEKTPQHVALSMIESLSRHDAAPAAESCNHAMAYISAETPVVQRTRDLVRLQTLCPHMVQSKTMLAGHFNTIEVADQVNAMIERFLAVGLRRTRTAFKMQ